jgi:Glycosyl transferase family 2
MNNKIPTISVLLPVYNCAEYVGAAIESLLAQSFDDFELIIIDDGSTDSTPHLLKDVNDPRIRLFTQSNRGLAATLNTGFELARGTYIARQDADDLSLPERFARQVAYLDAHPDCALVGTWAEIWVGDKRTERAHRHPSDNMNIQYGLLFNNPFVHSSVMLRKSALDQIGGYSTDPARQPSEDYELWSRIARSFEVANIPELLTIYREIPGSMSRTGVSPFLESLVTVCAENIALASDTSGDDPNPVNLAALIHSAPHRITGTLNFDLMKTMLQKAVSRVTQNDAHLLHEAESLVEHLRHNYWRSENPGPTNRLIYYAMRVKSRLSHLLLR